MKSPPNTRLRLIPRIDHGPRERTDFIVVHVTAGATAAGAMSWWAEGGHEADGAHLLIDNHAAYQTAPLDHICWHAGHDPNHRAIGIEHVGFPDQDWMRLPTMLELSANRCAWLHHEFGLGRPHWLGTVFPHGYGGAAWGGHPSCPGPRFPHAHYMHLVERAYLRHWGRR